METFQLILKKETVKLFTDCLIGKMYQAENKIGGREFKLTIRKFFFFNSTLFINLEI